MGSPTPLEYARSAATWAGVSLSSGQEAALLRFAQWLEEEAIPAGGLGPGEGDRVGSRHLGDSLLFAGGWRGQPTPASVLDLGSGVGLPGIPLAIALPRTAVVLLDRSSRRRELSRRALRVVGVDNATVVGDAIERHRRRYPVVVTRAALPPDRLRPILPRLLLPDGVAVVGWRWGEAAEDEAPPPGFEAIRVPTEVLDSPIRLLRMTAGGA